MKITAKFDGADGNSLTATFNQDDHSVVDSTGRKGTYTRADGSNIIEIKGEQSMTLTFAEAPQFTVGFSTGYSSSTGQKGTVTITALE